MSVENFLAGTVVLVICDKMGAIHIHHFKPEQVSDAMELMDMEIDRWANWGKCYEIRASDGRYVFHREFQQRTPG